jgi:glycosyltransferase involved in cell wall biosynthesis
MAPDCVVVMPVYNEAGCIRDVCLEWLKALDMLPAARLVAVNDGSSDASGAILAELATAAGGRLEVVEQANGGHGAAVRRGYERALESGCEWVFQVDSDGQFRAGDFEKLWRRRHEADFLLGRRAGRRDPAARRALSRAHGLLVGLLFGVSIRDPNCPFRLMRASCLAKMLERVPRTVFAPNVLLAIEARRAGLRFVEIPVGHLPRKAGTGSLRPLRLIPIAWRCFKELRDFRRAA